jgi:hypothetical protein
MGREFNRRLREVLTPPFRALGFIAGNIYSLLFGWHDKRLIAENQRVFNREVRDQLSFLFAEHQARIIPNTEARNLMGLNASVVTLAVGGLLLRFIRWRDEFRVPVASERTPNDWHELSLLLSVIETPEHPQRRAIYWLSDVRQWLRFSLDRITTAMSEPEYPLVEERLAEVGKYDRAATRQWETEINRRLYPDR